MTKARVLVTGATGKTGGAVVTELLAHGHPVRASVRRRDARSEALERHGAEVVVADIFDPDQLLDAMKDVQRAYYLPPIHPYAIQSAVAFSVAARSARLESIVQLSQWLSHRSHPSVMTRQTWLIDQLFAALPGIAHTIINPGLFADNFLRVIDLAALLGIYPVLTGDGKAAPISNEDIAKTAAAVLIRPERHAGMVYRPTGPKLLSGHEMASVIATVVGHRVVPLRLPYWVFRKVAQQQGVDPIQISGYRYYVQDMMDGAFAFEGGVTNAVEALTGSPAESFETTARRYAALPFARQTLGNRLKAFANFNLTLFYPGYNLDRLDKAWGFPMPPKPTLSLEDERWRLEHGALMAQQRPSGGATNSGRLVAVLGRRTGTNISAEPT